MSKLTEQDWDTIYAVADDVRKKVLAENNGNSANQCYEASYQIYNNLTDLDYDPLLIQGRVIVDNPDPSKISPPYDQDELDVMIAESCEVEVDEAREDDCFYTSTYCDVLCRPLHYWVELNGYVIDVTGDQFNNELETEEIPAILIEPHSSLPRYYKDKVVENV